MRATPLLELEGITYHYGARSALSDVSLSLAPGEILGLLGPNGSGKSTLMAIVAGLLRRQGGTIRFLGRDLPRPDRPFRAQLGVIFQDTSLDSKLSVRQNLDLAAQLRAMSRPRRRQRVAAALAAADLARRADDLLGQLSGGMRRRLDLARAMLHHPRLLLADEPTTGLDEPSFQRTWRQLDRLVHRREGRDAATGSPTIAAGVLLSTHRPEEAARCDRLIIIDQGKVVATDTPAALTAQVHGDIITLRGDDPEGLASAVNAALALGARVEGDEVLVACERGHELIVRIVEALPAGRIASINLRRPALADAFLKLTGTRLDADESVQGDAREAAA